MSDMSFFFTSMGSVMNQWSDFQIGKGMYRAYFNQQKEDIKAVEENFRKDKEYTNANDSLVSDQLKNLSEKTTESADALSKVVSGEDADEKKIYNSVSAFIESYNSLVKSTNESGNQGVTQKVDYMKNMSVIYGDRFNKVGVSVKEDGTLAVDKDKLQSADMTSIKNAFGDKNSFSTYVSSQTKLLTKFAESDAYLNNKSYYDQSGLISNTINNNASLLNGYTYKNHI